MLSTKINEHLSETYAELLKNDGQLGALPVDKFTSLASDDVIARTTTALNQKRVTTEIFDTKEEALAYLKSAIPEGSSVFNVHSTTLEEIGLIEHLKTQTQWINLKSPILANKDPAKSAQLYRQAFDADYLLASAIAVTEDGSIIAADGTGTKTAAFAPDVKGKLILVVGTQKIVPTFADAVARTHEFALPLESARMRLAYKMPGSQISNFIARTNASPFVRESKITVVFVKEHLGY